MSQPNPTTPAVDVAEGRRLWENAKAALAAEKAYEISNVQCYETVALYQAWAFDNAEALLRSTSENVSLREQVVSANEQRDAAVREAERLKTALKFYSEGFIPRPAKRNKYGLNPGLEWKPSEALLDDCGNVAMEALASAAQGGAK